MSIEKYLDKDGFARADKKVAEELKARVPISRTINGKPLTENISLTAFDVGGVTQSELDSAIQSSIQDVWASTF